MGAEKGIKRLSLLLFMAAFLAFFAVLSVSQGAAQIDLQAVIQALTETDNRRRIRLFAIFGYLVPLRACL